MKEVILEKELTIDTEKDEIAETGLVDIDYVSIDSEGNIYLINFKASENVIFKFDEKGDFITSFVRKGQGPGELQRPVSLGINNRDEILILDQLKRKYFIFRNEGGLVKEISIEPDISEVFPLSRGPHFLVWLPTFPSGTREAPGAIH